MTSPSIPRSTTCLGCILAIVALSLAGCGQQDLYEPPGAPYEVVGSVHLPSVNEGVDVLGHFAFVASGQAGLHVVDFSDPNHPELVTTVNTTKYAESIKVLRTFTNQTLIDLALVVEGTEGITSYDITDPGNVISFNQGTTAVDGNRIFVDQTDNPDEPYLVYLAESWKGVRIFDSDPNVPGLLVYNGVFAGTQGYAKGIAVKNEYAYVADDEMGLAVMDAQELVLGSFQMVSWADSPGNALDVAVDGNYAYVADGTEGLAVYYIDGPEEPQLIKVLDLSGYSRSIRVRDNTVFIAAAGGGVHFVDVRNPSDPIYLGTISTSYASDIALADDGYVLVADRDDGLLVLRGPGPFSDPYAPSPVTTLEAVPYGVGVAQLSWYATGDDRMIGQASSCEIRYSTTAINDESAWNAATVVANPPLPSPPGVQQSILVTDLTPGFDYHFAVRIRDDVNKISPLSNAASTMIFEGIVLRDPYLDRPYGITSDSYTYEVTYIFGTAPTSSEIIIDGSEVHTMSYVSGDYNTGALYRYQTSLGKGSHTYTFRFSAPGEDPVELPPADGPLVGDVAFEMGSLITELGREDDETYHGVVFWDSVYAAPHEVTQAEWTALGMTNNSQFVGVDLPVENVSWYEAVEYCNLLSVSDGLTPAYTINGTSATWDHQADGWRLPTEAEWEWLCRAGTSSAFAGGDITDTMCGIDPVLDLYGWYCGNSNNTTHVVGNKQPNAFGLYDMHGNVWEWCWDWYGDLSDQPQLDPEGPVSGFRRVIRGGSWYYFASDCRSASRGAYWPDSVDDIVGLRPVRTIFGN